MFFFFFLKNKSQPARWDQFSNSQIFTYFRVLKILVSGFYEFENVAGCLLTTRMIVTIIKETFIFIGTREK